MTTTSIPPSTYLKGSKKKKSSGKGYIMKIVNTFRLCKIKIDCTNTYFSQWPCHFSYANPHFIITHRYLPILSLKFLSVGNSCHRKLSHVSQSATTQEKLWGWGRGRGSTNFPHLPCFQ